jgi:hypothetical protein
MGQHVLPVRPTEYRGRPAWEEVQERKVQTVNGEISKLDCFFEFNERGFSHFSGVLFSYFMLGQVWFNQSSLS